MTDRRRRILACLVPAAVAFFAAQSWFVPGRVIAAGDVTPSARPGWEGQFGSHWNDLNGGPGGPSYTVVYLPEVAFAKAGRAAGLDDAAAQRIWLSTLYAAAAAAAAFFALGLGAATIGAVATGLIAVFNLYFVLVQPSSVTLVAFASAGLIGGVLLRIGAGRQRAGPFVLALSTVGIGHAFINPPIVAMLGLWLAAVTGLAIWMGGREAAARFGRVGLRALPLVIGVNAWWIVPAWMTLAGSGTELTSQTFTAQRDVAEWAWTHKRAGLSNVFALNGAWGWKEPAYFPFSARLDAPPLGMLRYLLPLVAFAAPLVARGSRRKAALAIALVALGSTWIAKGLNPPFAEVNELFYRVVPGYWLFREPVGKALFVTALAYAALAGLTVAEAVRGRRPNLRVIGAGVVVAAIVAYPFPLWTGEVVPDERPLLPSAHVRIPDEWHSAATFLNEQPDPGKLLVLPLADYYQMPTTWGYYGTDLTASILIDRPVLAMVPSGYYSPPGAVSQWLRSVEASLLGNSTVNLHRSLSALGVRYVLLRRDLDTAFPNRTFADPADLVAPLARTPGLQRVKSFGFLDLYRVSGGGEVQAATQLVRFAGSNDLLPIVVGALPAGTAVADPVGGVTSDATAFAFGIETLAEGTSSLPAETGKYLLVPTRQYGTLRVLTVIRRNKGVVVSASDDTSVTVGGRTISLEPTVTANLPSLPDSAVIRVANQYIALTRLPAGGRAGRAILHGDVSADAFVPGVRAILSPEGFGAVGDCHRTDNRTPDQLGIAAVRSGPVLRLAATEHSACVNAAVPSFREDAVYRVRMQHRSVAGVAPRFCLWQDGVDRCAAAQPLGASSEWRSFETLISPEEATTGLRLFLYADAEPGLAAVAEYRDVTVERLDKRASAPLKQLGTRPGPITLQGGSSVVRSAAGAEIAGEQIAGDAALTSLGDCFRRDAKTLAEAGITARATDASTIELAARDHTACVNVPVNPFDSAAVYRIRFRYRSVAGKGARACLWQEGIDRCTALAPLLRADGWHDFDTTLTADPRASGVRLFLYADGGAPVRTRILYRDLRIEKLPPAEFIVVPAEEPPAPPAIHYWRLGPAEFSVRVEKATGPFVLHLSETFARGWRLERPGAGSAKHIRVNRYANGWIVPWKGTYEVKLVYAPERAASVAKTLSLVSLAASIGGVAVFWWVSRRRRRAERHLGAAV